MDILSIEKSGTFRGKFHVLGGKISPLDGVEPEDLRIAELEKRLAHEPIQEIIIALGTDVEGDATSHYLAKRLARPRAENLAHRLRPARRQRTGIRRRTHLKPRAGRPPGNVTSGSGFIYHAVRTFKREPSGAVNKGAS